MIALLQRVAGAAVTVEGVEIGAVDEGVLVLLGVKKGDTDDVARTLADKTADFRILAGADGRPDVSLSGRPSAGALVVSQFTLAADTTRGRRADYGPAAPAAEAERLYESFVARLRDRGVAVATGRFGADMRVRLVNDGPVTFWLEVNP